MEYLVIFLPLVAALISGFFGRIIGEKNSTYINSILVSISALLSVIIFYK